MVSYGLQTSLHPVGDHPYTALTGHPLQEIENLKNLNLNLNVNANPNDNPNLNDNANLNDSPNLNPKSLIFNLYFIAGSDNSKLFFWCNEWFSMFFLFVKARPEGLTEEVQRQRASSLAGCRWTAFGTSVKRMLLQKDVFFVFV